MIISQQASAFAEDVNNGSPHRLHSSFHFELTRTLANAAGFNEAQANLIATFSQATDSGEFQSDLAGAPLVNLMGTQRRIPEESMFFHFPRRGTHNLSGLDYPGGRDTCQYFQGTDDPCLDESEISLIERWAVWGEKSLLFAIPEAQITDYVFNVAGASLPALGIYLHALADSYSHEACGAKAQLRGHSEIQANYPECSLDWHKFYEFGDNVPDPSGVGNTKEAALAMWQALTNYRDIHELANTQIWDDAEAQVFIDEWVMLVNAEDRADLANSPPESITAQF